MKLKRNVILPVFTGLEEQRHGRVWIGKDIVTGVHEVSEAEMQFHFKPKRNLPGVWKKGGIFPYVTLGRGGFKTDSCYKFAYCHVREFPGT
jgi:hypothetical protein